MNQDIDISRIIVLNNLNHAKQIFSGSVYSSIKAITDARPSHFIGFDHVISKSSSKVPYYFDDLFL